MLQDFSSDKTLQSLREAERIKQEYEKVLQKLHETASLGYAKNMRRATLEREMSQALIVKRTTSIFSRLASIFHVGEYYEAMQLAKAKEEELARVTEEWAQLAEEEGKLKACEEVIGREKNERSIPECIREEQGRVVITDKKTGLGDGCLVKDSTTVEPSKKVLVHCTNFFPRDNKILSDYDGEKIGTVVKEYHGVKKETSALIHRHEVHFTINNRVENTGAGEGNWDNPSYIIIDGYDAHPNEMESNSPSDAWTKGTSVQLSNSAVIMVRLQDKDKLPISPEEMKNYNIIFYEGNATVCLRNFLRLNNYDIFDTDPNCPAHACSNRMKQETGANARDLAINFVRDNTHFSKEPPSFSEEEIAQIVDIGYLKAPGIISNAQLRLCSGGRYDLKFNGNRSEYSTYLNELERKKVEREQYLNVANFVIGSGMKIAEDGSYTFCSDDEIFDTIESLEEDTETLPSCVDVGLINKIFEMQQELSERHKSMTLPSIEEFSSMPLQELYRFQNQSACEALQKTLPEHADMIYGKNGVTIKVVECKNEDEDISGRVRPEDGIDYIELCGVDVFEKIIDGATSASNVGKSFDELKLLIEQIKGRNIVSSEVER